MYHAAAAARVGIGRIFFLYRVDKKWTYHGANNQQNPSSRYGAMASDVLVPQAQKLKFSKKSIFGPSSMSVSPKVIKFWIWNKGWYLFRIGMPKGGVKFDPVTPRVDPTKK